MGNCCSPLPHLPSTISYPNSILIQIKEKDLRNRTITIENLILSLPPPLKQHTEKFHLPKTEYFLSSCILPSTDPKNLLKKPCQDNFCFTSHSSLLFFALFDGHGKFGKEIVSCCESLAVNYFHSNFLQFSENIEEGIKNLIQACDDKVKEIIECELSGCTALIVVVSEDGFWVGSVGDSRAVLGTFPGHKTKAESVLIRNNRYFRMIEPARELRSLVMSVDQKPNLEMEYRRIVECGGIVQQLTTAYGTKIGPFRVWKPSTPYPGLAMSRSIGDTLGKSVGIISTPLTHFFPHHPYRDSFFLLASDGLWDVMENIEAVNFVEKFKKSCQTQAGNTYPANPQHSTIAQLLAEEARYRWLGLCEEEDCTIDDISVMIIEIRPLEPVPVEIPVGDKRKTLKICGFACIQQTNDYKSGVLRGDIMRGSFVPQSEDL